jgi:hypothetical protein
VPVLPFPRWLRCTAWCTILSTVEAVEFATLAWVEWFNTRRLLEPIGYVPPAEYEDAHYQTQKMIETPAMGVGVN